VRLVSADASNPRRFTLGELYRYPLKPDEEFVRTLRTELPLRYELGARRLRCLPFGLAGTVAVVSLAAKYEEFGKRLTAARDVEDEAFSAALATIAQQSGRQVGVEMKSIAVELDALREHAGGWDHYHSMREEVDRGVRDFNCARIGVRLLGDVAVAVHSNRIASRDNSGQKSLLSQRKQKASERGCVQADCCVVGAAKATAAYVQEMFEENLYCCPQVSVEGDNAQSIAYIPTHVWYVLSELLKNACKATIDANRGPTGRPPPSRSLPPVVMVVRTVDNEVEVEMRDEGGGIPEELRDLIWSYMFSTANREGRRKNIEVAGAGVGLPISRLYTEYFGGSLTASFEHVEGSAQGSVFRARIRHDENAMEQLHSGP